MREATAPGAPASPRSPTRRTVLAALAASGASAVLSGPLRAATASGRPLQLVDVHHHLFTPSMAAALSGSVAPAMLPGAQRSLDEMRIGGVATAMISYPNTDITVWPAARLAALMQKANEEAAAIVQRYPHRYGLFGSLPMPYVDESVRELDRLYEQLPVDGVLLLTSYADRWLGNPAFAPLLEQLNHRQAVVFVHPATPLCCGSLMPGLNPSVIEYETDTARTIASLMFTGSVDRFPQIRWIFSHAGGTMPSLIERFRTATRSSPTIAGHFARTPDDYLRSFYYDTAQAANPVAIGALLQVVPASQVLFGTDFPYRHADQQSDALRAMNLGPQRLDGILWGNARRLLPRLRGQTTSA